MDIDLKDVTGTLFFAALQPNVAGTSIILHLEFHYDQPSVAWLATHYDDEKGKIGSDRINDKEVVPFRSAFWGTRFPWWNHSRIIKKRSPATKVVASKKKGKSTITGESS
jgi:hypothetical protein